MSGHTEHCLKRQLYGDGECECGVPGWRDGVIDSICTVQARKNFLKSLGPPAMPARGVIEVLDDVLISLEAMLNRGSYSSQSTMMTSERMKSE